MVFQQFRIYARITTYIFVFEIVKPVNEFEKKDRRMGEELQKECGSEYCEIDGRNLVKEQQQQKTADSLAVNAQELRLAFVNFMLLYFTKIIYYMHFFFPYLIF